MPPRFADLGDLPEDERIATIGAYAEAHLDQVVGVVVDRDADGRKAARYQEKLMRRHRVQIVDVTPGPVAKSTLIRIVRHADA